jgi:hypothetical protein
LQHFQNGMRLVAFDFVHASGGKPKYVGVWRANQGPGAQWVPPGSHWTAFVDKAEDYFNQNLCLVAFAATYDGWVPFD